MAQAQIGALRVDLGLSSAKFTKGLSASQKKMRKFGRSMAKIGAAMSVVGTGVTLAIKSQLNAADEMAKSAQKFGVPIEALSQLKHAAELSGVAFDTLGTGLRTLSKNMDQAAQGQKLYGDLFDRLGVKISKSDGSLRDTTTVFTELTDAIAALPGGAEKTALAVQVLGRSGAELIPLMNGGSEALRGMMKEADALGLTITAKTGKVAEQFNDNLTRLGRTLSGIALQLAAALAPILAKITNAVVKFSERFRNLSESTQTFIGVTAALTIALGPVLISMGLMATALSSVASAMGVVRVALLAMTGPWGLLAGLIGAALAGFVLWRKAAVDIPEPVDEARRSMHMLNESLAGFGELSPDMQSAALTNALALKKQAEAAIAAARAQLQLQKSMVADAEARLSDGGAVSAFGSLMGQNDLANMSAVVESLENDLDLANSRIKNVATSITSQMAPAVEAGATSTKTLKVELEGTSAALGGLGGAIDDLPPIEVNLDRAADAANRLKTDLSDTFSSIVTGSENAREAIGRLAERLSNMIVSNAFDSFFGSLIKSGSGFGKIANLIVGSNANGTPFFGGGLSMVGERGPELVNLPRGSQVFNSQKSARMMGGGQTVLSQSFTIHGSNMGPEEMAARMGPLMEQKAVQVFSRANREGR